jgi:hypothetical protein
MLLRLAFKESKVAVFRASLSDALRMTSLSFLAKCKAVAFVELAEEEELGMADFTENGWAGGAGGGGEIGGAMVEGFVGQ